MVFPGWITKVAILGPAAAISAVCVAAVDDAGFPEFVFLTVLLWFLFNLLRVLAGKGWCALTEHRLAGRLESTAAGDVARQAVVEERVRLAADIEAVVRASVTRMGELARWAASRWDGDPTPALHSIQDEGNRAASELRRMLGLLREAEHPDAVAAPASVTKAWFVRRIDIVLGLVAAALSAADRIPYTPDFPASMRTGVSLLLTCTAAAVVALRWRAPRSGAAICGAVFLAGALSANPLNPGFWILLTPAWLAFAAMSTLSWRGIGATALLMGGIAANLGWYNPVNLPMCEVIIAVGAIGGAVAGWSNKRQASVHEQVLRRSSELDAAAEDAVRGERVTVARDLHDVVSHTVAVMVLQAGAAEALRPLDPPRARAALAIVEQTAVDALVELDRMVAAIGAGTMGASIPTTGAVEHDDEDLRALADRMNGAGLRISLTQDGPVHHDIGAVVYRIVQEALTNAARHAQGATVTVTVRARAELTTVEVVDDGPGSSNGPRRGYGLVGIAERVQHLSGQLSTGPAVGNTGFRVSARLPTPDTVTT